MNLIIEGRRAVLKKDTSFDYASENRAFSDADDYTLSISLPLAGCPENIAIFGRVDRMDCSSRKIVKEAAIVDPHFIKNGVITVVEASETEVKIQFLEGRSVQNFDTTFDDFYINELALGRPISTGVPTDPYSVYGTIDNLANYVALPWVNESSEGVMNNEVIVVDGAYQWAESTQDAGHLSFQPYLYYIARRICNALGYTCEFSDWANSDDLYLLVCNALPGTWGISEFARALPHWTVTEFFEELEKILVAEIDIDHRTKHISLKYCDNIESTHRVVVIDNPVDEFSSEVSYQDNLCQFKGVANIRYADRGDSLWELDSCQWLVDLMKQEGKYKEFETETHLWEYLEPLSNKVPYLQPEIDAEHSYLFHVVETDRYGLFKLRKPGSEDLFYWLYEWVDINRFGDVVHDAESGNDIELNCVPVRIDSTDNESAKCIFLSPSSFGEDNNGCDDDGVPQPRPYLAFKSGESDSAVEYYDKLYLAYWDGSSCNGAVSGDNIENPPCPYTDSRFALKNRYAKYLSGQIVNPKEKIKISWIAKTIPPVRAVFHIRGKRFLCEKITATFTENGMSQLLKGDFYPIVED